MIDDDVANDVILGLSLEADDFFQNHLLVFGDGFGLDRFDDFDILLSASNEHLSFHQLDQTLNKACYFR